MIIRTTTDRNARSGSVVFAFTDNRRNDILYNLVKAYNEVVQID